MTARTRYAERTAVPEERSRRDIDILLRKAGADAIATYSEKDRAAIAFRLRRTAYRFTVPFPKLAELRDAGSGRSRTQQQCERLRETLIRERWRALLLALKAKIEAERAGIIDLEVSLMPFALLPGGATVADEVMPKLAQMQESGKDVPLLLGTHP